MVPLLQRGTRIETSEIPQDFAWPHTETVRSKGNRRVPFANPCNRTDARGRKFRRGSVISSCRYGLFPN